MLDFPAAGPEKRAGSRKLVSAFVPMRGRRLFDETRIRKQEEPQTLDSLFSPWETNENNNENGDDNANKNNKNALLEPNQQQELNINHVKKHRNPIMMFSASNDDAEREAGATNWVHQSRLVQRQPTTMRTTTNYHNNPVMVSGSSPFFSRQLALRPEASGFTASQLLIEPAKLRRAFHPMRGKRPDRTTYSLIRY